MKINNRFLFFDRVPAFYDSLIQKSLFNSKVIIEDAENLRPEQFDMIVSPANSFGFMDGGIDWVYSRKMFPMCETHVKEAIKYNGLQTSLGRYYLPIGSCLPVNIHYLGKPKTLLVVPTMFFPSEIRGTKNVYYAMMSILQYSKHFENKTIAVPGLGVGVGNVSWKDFSDQIEQAFDDFIKNKNSISNEDSVNIMFDSLQKGYILSYCPTKQLSSYANREMPTK